MSAIPIEQPEPRILPLEPELPTRGQRDRLWEALRGVKLGVRGQSSFFVHFFFCAVAIAASAVMQIEPVEWCLLVGAMGFVFAAELFCSAIETVVHALDGPVRTKLRGVLNITAGAVLVTRFTAGIIGIILFGNRIASLLSGS